MAGTDPDRPQPQHEETDVNAWAVGKFAIGLALTCIFSLVLLAGLFRYFESITGGLKPRAQSGLNLLNAKLPPQPRLEETPVKDLREIRAEEERILTTYGWVDKSTSTVRIPIDRAIDLLAQRGIAARPQAQPQTATDATVPTESGLGEKVQQPGGPLAQSVGQAVSPAIAQEPAK
jgi:hypothetical protein